MQQFMAAPDKLCAAVIGRAGQSPELIHLLRLQEQFPGTSIAKLLSSAASAAGNHAVGRPGGLAVIGARRFDSYASLVVRRPTPYVPHCHLYRRAA